MGRAFWATAWAANGTACTCIRQHHVVAKFHFGCGRHVEHGNKLWYRDVARGAHARTHATDATPSVTPANTVAPSATMPRSGMPPGAGSSLQRLLYG